MTTSAYVEARDWAAHWAQHWFLDATGRDRILISGVEAGWATHIEAYQLLLRFALTELGAAEDAASRSPAALLKRQGLDRALRSFGLRLLTIATRQPAAAAQREPVAFVAEIPTPSMLEPVALTASQVPLRRRIVAAADPRAFRRLSRSVPPVLALVSSIGEARRLLREASHSVEAQWVEILRQPPTMALDGRDVTESALTALEPLVTRSMPWLAPERETAHRLISRINAQAIAIASDQHRVGRIMAQIGTERGVRVTVLQHGLPQASIGFLPVVAPTVAVWSTASSAWFSGHGTSPNRLAVLGNPRFDELVEIRRRRQSPDAESSHRPHRFLLALSPTSVATNRHVTSVALGAMQKMPGARLVIKLHPGQSDWRFLNALVSDSAARGRIRIARHEPLYPLLSWADVTLAHRSTVALESLVAGTPLVAISAPEPSVADEELADLALPVAHTSSDLVELLSMAAANRGDFFAERADRLERVAGPLDGQSARRIAAFLCDPTQDVRPRPVATPTA